MLNLCEYKNSIKERYDLDKDKFYIGSFQRDTEGSDLKTPKLEKGPDIVVAIVNNDNLNDYLITLIDKKIELLSLSDLDYLYIIDFNQQFASMEADYFIQDFLHSRFNPADIIVGYDHFFGKNVS